MDASITKRTQVMKERLSGVENVREEIDCSVKENVKYKKKIPNSKYPENLGNYEKMKPKNNSKRIPDKWHENISCKDKKIKIYRRIYL